MNDEKHSPEAIPDAKTEAGPNDASVPEPGAPNGDREAEKAEEPVKVLEATSGDRLASKSDSCAHAQSEF